MDEDLESLSKEELIERYKNIRRSENELICQNERLRDELWAKKEVCAEIDYKKEYEVLTWQLHCVNDELNQYRKALLNVCFNLRN